MATWSSLRQNTMYWRSCSPFETTGMPTMLSLPEALQLGADLDDQLVRQSMQSSSGDIAHYLRIGCYGLILADELVGEVLEPTPPLHRIPGQHRALAGAVNVRGNVVPVFDLHACLGVNHEGMRQHALFVYGQDDAMAAFYMDQLPARLRRNELLNYQTIRLPALVSACVRQSFLLNELIILDIDIAQLLDALNTPQPTDC